ncbi:MAG: ParA family protein [Bdellovibrionota bacterium]
MDNIIAIANQKGGVGKTTSAISLSAELAMMGRKVLLVDFDPQGNATSGLGVEFQEQGEDLYDVFFGRVPLASIIKKTAVKGLEVAPSSHDLVGVEIELGREPGRELILRSQLRLNNKKYDYVIIDCPPSSGLLTLNALGAADKLLIPLQAEYYALEGLSQLLETIRFVNGTFNPELGLIGVFLTMFDNRTNLAGQVEQEVREYFNELAFETRIPRNVKISEAPSHGMPVCLYAPDSRGAKAYHELAVELDNRCFGGPVFEQRAANA